MDFYMWLAKNRIGIKEFSKMIHYDPQHIYAVVNGRREPSNKFISLVEHASKGEVTKEDFIELYLEGLRNRQKKLSIKQNKD